MGYSKQVQSVVLIKGTQDQISKAKAEIKKMFDNDENHQCKYELDKQIPSTMFKELDALCRKKYAV